MKILSVMSFAFALSALASPVRAQEDVDLDVPYVPTRPSVVDAMLRLAEVKKGDVVYDLGCGDGRIVIAAAKKYGATGKGFDLDPRRISEANANARKEGVSGKVQFVRGNLFDVDLSGADVITLYLLPDVNIKLRPKLQALKPGTRIVSHAFDMDEWEPEKTEEVDGATIYLWRIPARK